MLLLSCQMRKDWQPATENDSQLISSYNINADSSICCPDHCFTLNHGNWDDIPAVALKFHKEYFIRTFGEDISYFLFHCTDMYVLDLENTDEIILFCAF